MVGPLVGRTVVDQCVRTTRLWQFQTWWESLEPTETKPTFASHEQPVSGVEWVRPAGLVVPTDRVPHLDVNHGAIVRRSDTRRESMADANCRRVPLDVAQNIYDDEAFFEGYATLPRSIHGHDGAPEWPTLRDMVPDLRGCRVLDLGCGFGWFSRWAADNGAEEVLGIDLSERMLARARAETSATTVVYQQHDLDDVTLTADAFHVAYSSLTLHYLDDIKAFLAKVHAALRADGVFVFSVEHPMFTAPSNPAFVASPDGSSTWPVDRYLIEGSRVTDWFAPGVVKQHRTIATYVNSLITTGFQIDALVEWGPTAEQVAAVPAWANEIHRPPFLLIRAHRP